MNRHSLLAAIAALCCLASTAFAQVPPPLPMIGPAPLLYVRFQGPSGLRVTFYRGLTAIPFEAPVTVGLRPGYLYRAKLTNWPDRPGLALYPTLEVRGTLCLPPKLNVANFPAPVVLDEADLQRLASGSLVTKVVYLEDPERAIPNATQPAQPGELDLPPGYDLMAEARDRGRPMLIVRLGQREVSDQELAHQSIPGTILLPGEKVLPPAQCKPWIPWAGVQVYDPILGPKPLTEECFHDGGDGGVKAGIGADGRLRGLDPSDTMAEYSDSKGRRHLTISNRVCLCVPRFVVLRSECPIAGASAVLTPSGTQAIQGQVQLEMRQPSLESLQYEQLAALRARKRPNEAQAIQGVGRLLRVEVLEAHQLDIGPVALLGRTAPIKLEEVQRTRLVKQMEFARELSLPTGPQTVKGSEGTSVVGKVQGLDIISSATATLDLTVCCNEVPCPPAKPLVLFKWANCQAAQVGDVVTFFLKYSNHGGKPITDVAVLDSLTARLEYVAGTAKSDRPSVFTTQENEAGSVILRWEVNGQLLPGASGVVSFQARIR